MESHEDDVMAQLASQYYSLSRSRSASAPIRPATIGNTTWKYSKQLGMASNSQLPLPPPPAVDTMAPMNSPSNGDFVDANGVETLPSFDALSFVDPGDHDSQEASVPEDESASPLRIQLPATFLRSVCDQLEFYFCDDNLLGDLYLLKNMNADGYVKLELLASFGRIKKLTSDLSLLREALEVSTKLIMNEDETMVCRKEPLAPEHSYNGKLARTAIAYNLPEDASIAFLREKFIECGTISYLRLLKQNTSTGRNAVLKPPINAGETYAIIEFTDEEMAKHAVLTLSDQYNWRTGMQVVLFDGTNCDKLKQKMFPVEMGGDRRRARSTSAVSRPVHVDAVGEGLDGLQEGRVSTGTVYSIRGAGGLINPTRLENAAISFRLVPDEDGNMDIRPGDYVSFTVGKNKKSGRKYASKVRLEFRPPSSSSASPTPTEFRAPSPGRWESRNRSSTVGTPSSQPNLFRSRSSSNGSRPKLALSSPRVSSAQAGDVATLSYRQASGPDGTRGFAARRICLATPEVSVSGKFTSPVERRRSHSSTCAPLY